MDNRPIGVFDSGLGGLCAVADIKRLLPKENIIYFGDTGRVPYGTKSYATIKKYALQDMRFLQSKNVKVVLAACGTVSSTVLDEIKDAFPFPVFGVVDDAVAEAVSRTKNKKIGVIGTDATIACGVFERKIRATGSDISIISRPCPLFVALVENGFITRGNKVTKLVAEEYLQPIKEAGADTLILGCTHFPIIADIIGDCLHGVTLINPATAAAARLARELKEKEMTSSDGGNTEYYVSDEPQRFTATAKIFLGGDTISAEKIEIEKY